MAEFAAWVESTTLSKTLFGMSWLWPLCESLHFIGLCMLIGGAGSARPAADGHVSRPRHPARESADAVGDRRVRSSTRATGTLFLIMQPHLYLSSACLVVEGRIHRRRRRECVVFRNSAGAFLLCRWIPMPTRRGNEGRRRVSLFSWFAVLYCGRMLPYLGTGN